MIHQHHKHIPILLSAILLSAIFSCTNHPEKSQPTIAVSIEPLRFFVEQIAGDRYEVLTMVPSTSSPETYEPTAQQMVQLSQSAVYIKVGEIGFERTWISRLTENSPKMAICNASNGIPLLKTPQGHEDPHTWMSTANARIMATNICEALTEALPSDSTMLRQNLSRLLTTIDSTEQVVTGLLARCHQKGFIVYHPSLTYFAHENGLLQLAIEEEGHEPSARQIQELIVKARQENIKVLLMQEQFANRHTTTILKETGAVPMTFNPLNPNWPSEMIHIAQILSQ